MNTSTLLGVITVTVSFTLVSQAALALNADESLVLGEVEQANIRPRESDLTPDQRRVATSDERVRYYGAKYLSSGRSAIEASGQWGIKLAVVYRLRLSRIVSASDAAADVPLSKSDKAEPHAPTMGRGVTYHF